MLSAKVLLCLQVMLAGLSLLGLIITLFFGNWIELLFGVDPDGGDGTLERFVVLGLMAGTAAVMALLAYRNQARMRRAMAGDVS